MPTDIKTQIIEWARDNYDESYSAQTVIECWDDSDFVRFESLQDFLDTYAGPKQDQYDDMRSEVF